MNDVSEILHVLQSLVGQKENIDKLINDLAENFEPHLYRFRIYLIDAFVDTVNKLEKGGIPKDRAIDFARELFKNKYNK